MIAILSIIFFLGGNIMNKNVTLYIDDSNARDALVKGILIQLS